MYDIPLILFDYALMLQQKFEVIKHVDIVSDDTEILEQLKSYKHNEIGLYMVEPEIQKTGNQDQANDTAFMQIILVSKTADRNTLRQTMSLKNDIYNLCYAIDLTLQRHKEDIGDFNYQFSKTDDALPNQDPTCQLLHKLEVKTIQKTPISISKTYIGWTLTFKTTVI